jgi:hypothetical protein
MVRILISRNHSITQLISFPKKVKKRPCSEINTFMNWDPEDKIEKYRTEKSFSAEILKFLYLKARSQFIFIL